MILTLMARCSPRQEQYLMVWQLGPAVKNCGAFAKTGLKIIRENEKVPVKFELYLTVT